MSIFLYIYICMYVYIVFPSAAYAQEKKVAAVSFIIAITNVLAIVN